MGTHIILAGNCIDGIDLYGPFRDHERACIWAEENLRNTIPWCIAELTDPTDAFPKE